MIWVVSFRCLLTFTFGLIDFKQSEDRIALRTRRRKRMFRTSGEFRQTGALWGVGMRIGGRVLVLILLGFFGFQQVGQAANFACAAGDVTCLIAAIYTANWNGQANTITLAAGTYAPSAVDNFTGGPNDLPSITSTLTI